MPHHFRTCSGFVIASNTSSMGASNRRVSMISRSEGVVVLNVSLLAARLTGMAFLPGLEVLKDGVEAVQPSLPHVAIPVGPLGHLLQGRGLQAAGPPLGVAA